MGNPLGKILIISAVIVFLIALLEIIIGGSSLKVRSDSSTVIVWTLITIGIGLSAAGVYRIIHTVGSIIQGYPEKPSVFPGDILTLHVSTDAPKFYVEFYRQGVALEKKMSSDWMIGYYSKDHDWDQDWNISNVRRDGTQVDGWRSYDFRIPSDWPSGVYIAMFVMGTQDGTMMDPQPDRSTSYAETGKTLFVVKNPNPGSGASVLYKIPLFTYHAYNKKGGNSLYQGYPAGKPVNLHRPGGGTGALPWDSWSDQNYYDPYDSTPRQTFVHYDAKFISWLENQQQGYSVDYCTDLDIHNDDNLELLSPYAVVLSVGHDEYYTENMRDNLETYIANGGNVAFFSGNTSYHIAVIDEINPLWLSQLGLWTDTPYPNRPEDSLTGVSYRNAGEADRNRPEVGFTVQHTDFWPFENTNLDEGSIIGLEQGLVGYECDGTPYDRITPPFVPKFDPKDCTPTGFVILGTGDLIPHQCKPNGSTDFCFYGPTGSNMGATMGTYTNNGTVFTAATTDWPRVVFNGEPKTGKITSNVLNRFGGNPIGIAQLSNFVGIKAVDGFFSSDDNNRHAIVATSNGDISEIFFNPQDGQGVANLGNFPGILDIAAFFSPDDNNRHAIIATSNGDISEIFFNPQDGQGVANLGNFPRVTRIAAFYSSDDNYRHVIVAASNGDISEIFFNPQGTPGISSLGNFPGIVDIAAFFSPDDKYRHVIVATNDGSVYELYYSPKFGQNTVLLGNFPGIIRVGAFYANDDSFFNRRVIVSTQNGRIHEIRFSPRGGIIRSVRANLPANSITDIGGFFSSDDGYRHIITATANGDIKEIFYDP